MFGLGNCLTTGNPLSKQRPGTLKKILVILLVLVLLAISFAPVQAGGDQVRGGTGDGQGDQETHEVGCEEQPCMADAPQPQPGP